MTVATYSLDYSDPETGQKVSGFYFLCVCFSIFVYVARPGEIFSVVGYARLGLTSFVLTALAFFMGNGPQIVRQMAPTGVGLMKFLLFLGFAGIVFSVYPRLALESWKGQLIHTSLFFFWLPAVRSPSQIRGLIAVMAVSGGCLVASMLFLGVGNVSSEGRHSVGQSYDPNDTAMVLGAIFPLVVFLFVRGGLISKLCWGALLAGFSLAILQTGSRGGTIAFAASCLFLLFTLPSSMKLWHKSVLVVVVIAFFTSPAAELFKERFQFVLSGEDYNFGSRDEGSAGRVAIWKDSLVIIGERPLTGAGIGCATVAMGSRFGWWKTTHNAYLQMGVDLGVAGLVAFLLLLRTIWRNCNQSRRTFAKEPPQPSMPLAAACTQIALATYMVAAMFLSQAYSILVPILLLLSNGLAFAAQKHEGHLDTQGQNGHSAPTR